MRISWCDDGHEVVPVTRGHLQELKMTFSGVQTYSVSQKDRHYESTDLHLKRRVIPVGPTLAG